MTKQAHYERLALYTALFFLAVLIGSVFSGSITLWGETLHIGVDSSGIWLLWGAVLLHARGFPERILHAGFWLNIVLLYCIALFMIGGGVVRFATRHAEVQSLVWLTTAIVGYLVSKALHRYNERLAEEHRDRSFHVAHLHFRSDIVQYGGTILAALIAAALDVAKLPSWWVDPLASVTIGAWMAAATTSLAVTAKH